METAVACVLSAGRLLLVNDPVMFHKVRPVSAGAIVAGLLAVNTNYNMPGFHIWICDV